MARGGISWPLNTLAPLATALADGSVRVVDLTQPLSESTPVLQLPPPFANTPGLCAARRSAVRRPRPRLGVDDADRRRARRHPLRRPDPLDHRPRRRGRRAASPPAKLVAPAAVIDKSAEAAADPNYLLTLADIQAWENEHGAAARRAAGCSCAPAGTPAPTTRRRSSTAPQTPGPGRRGRPLAGRGVADRRLRRGDRRHRRGRRALASTRRSRSTTSCSARASTASRSSRTWPSCRRPARSSSSRR